MRSALSLKEQRIFHDLEIASHDLPLSEVRCPACETRPGHLALIRNGFRVVRCDACCSLFVNPRPAEGPLIEFYRQRPGLVLGREGVIGPEDSLSEAQYRLRRLTTFTKAGRLLDVGSGQGDFLVIAQAAFQAQGVDIAPRLKPAASNIPVFEGKLEDARFGNESFDVVTAVEVLEHLFDPRRTLKEIHRILRPLGLLLVQTGDADSLRARLNLKTWLYVQPPVHLNIFSRRGLALLLRETGFRSVGEWSFGRAPQRVFPFGRAPSAEVLRPVLDLAARWGILGQMYIARKE